MKTPPPERLQHHSVHKNSWMPNRAWVSKGRRGKLADLQQLQCSQMKTLSVKAATANVNTMAPQEEREMKAMGQGLLASGKIQRLERDFEAAEYDLVGIQESRIQSDADVNKNEYRIIGAAATPSGTLGVQLWVAHRLRATLIEARPVDPRSVFAVLRCSVSTITVGVGRSPIEGSGEAAAFYETFSANLHELKHKYHSAHILILADFNAKLGSVAADHIGTWEAQEENSNGMLLRFFLGEHNLAAVNTFFEEGAGYTWTGTQGHLARIDYILWSLSELCMVEQCAVNRDIRLADCERDDHCLVAACIEVTDNGDEIAVQPDVPVANRSTTRRLCNAKLEDGGIKYEFEQWIWQCKAQPNANNDLQLKSLQNHAREGATLFEAGPVRPKQKWILEQTWAMMGWRNQAKKALRSTLASVLFLAWA